MTETLEKLEELFPEKFEYISLPESFYIMQPSVQRVDFDSQDGIDSILAEIGWEYEVTKPDVSGWQFVAWGTHEKGYFEHPVEQKLHKTKLLAAQAALKAVVEELKKGEG